MNSNPVNIDTFSKLIEKYNFFIPSYQRAYAWTEKQVDLFIADLEEHAQSKTQYYLGHYILESQKVSGNNGRTPVDIVDGQQRLTTVAIFLAVCRYLSNSNDLGTSLQLSVVEYDKERFDEVLLPDTLKLVASQKDSMEKTASLRRVVQAIQTIYKSFSKSVLLSVDKIEDYLKVISEAAVSVGVYESKAVAAQIFELHNTRGALLTETEKVKAILMKHAYLKGTEEDVTAIQKSFAGVFELEEKAASVSFRGEMSLDEILAHHLRAVDDGEKHDSFNTPQGVEGKNGCVEYVKAKLAKFPLAEAVTYAKNLASEFNKTMELLTHKFVELDVEIPLIGDVILLDQRRSMIFLLRYFRALDGENPDVDEQLLRRWESFISIWDYHDAYYNMKAGKKDSFDEIFVEIQRSHSEVSKMLLQYYSAKERFAYRGLDHDLGKHFQNHITKNQNGLLREAYGRGDWHGRCKYWLYKYEIEIAGDQKVQVRNALRGLFKENDVTLDHIVPRGLEWKYLSTKEGDQNNDLEKWEDPANKEQAVKIWEEIEKTINGIGNLVLLSRSANAVLQNIPPYLRAEKYREIFELDIFSYKDVETWNARAEWSDKSTDAWNKKIEKRGEDILKMIKGYFTDSTTWPAYKDQIDNTSEEAQVVRN